MKKQDRQIIQAVEAKKQKDEEYYDYLLAQIRAGKIKHDNNLYLVDIDEAVQFIRGDLLPIGGFTLEHISEHI